MMPATKKHLRLYGKSQPRLPKPVGRDKGSISLKAIDSADHRFAVVKRLRRRVEQLVKESGCTNLAGEMIAARAAHIAAYLESCEIDALNARPVDYSLYLQATRTLSDLLNKLGLKKEASSADDLGSIIDDLHRKAKRKRKGKR